MSTTVGVITILTFLLGLINQGIAQGSLFAGLVKVPPTWLPYLTIAASFLGGFITSLQGQTINGASLVAAVVAGIMQLASSGAGIAICHHMGQPKRTLSMRKPPANDSQAPAAKAA